MVLSNCLSIFTFCFRGIRKGVKPSDCLFFFLVPLINHATKQTTNGSHPNGHEPSAYLSSVAKFCGFDKGEQERESSNPQSMSNGENYVTHIFRFRLIMFVSCKIVPVGDPHPCGLHPDSFSRYFLFLVFRNNFVNTYVYFQLFSCFRNKLVSFHIKYVQIIEAIPSNALQVPYLYLLLLPICPKTLPSLLPTAYKRFSMQK